jgi:hypothetical protein
MIFDCTFAVFSHDLNLKNNYEILTLCYRHNLAEPEGGPRTRWTQKMNTINFQISSCTGVWRAKIGDVSSIIK